MHAFDDGLDPTSLVALEALLKERSVTRAARLCGVTQSTMSHRLAQLRRALGDPLLVRVGARLEPTPRGLRMLQPLTAALSQLRAAVSQGGTHAAPEVPAQVTLSMPDLLAPLLPQLVHGLVHQGRPVPLTVVTPPPGLAAALATGAPSLALGALGDAGAGVVARALGEVTFAVVGRRGHPAFRRPLTTAAWLSHAHVTVQLGNGSANAVGGALQKGGWQRTVGLVVPNFLSGLMAVAGTDLLMNAPVPLVHHLLDTYGLVLRPAPVPLPRLRVALLWHERFNVDPPHRWARERVLGVVRKALTTTLRPARDAG